MSDEDGYDGASQTPVDRSALVRILDRLRTNRQVHRGYLTIRHDEPCLIVEFDLEFYPAGVEDAYLTVRWYRNDDFKIHYHETRERASWDCRWDRHPNQHNAYEHFHPPPAAPTRGDDASYPDGLHDVMRLVETEVNARIRSLWGADSESTTRD